MSGDQGHAGPSWVEAGALIGACVGLGDGLRSAAHTDGPLGQAFPAVLLSTLISIWVFGVGLPIFLALFTPRASWASNLGAGFPRRRLRVLGWVSVASVPASAAGLAVLGLVTEVRPAANHNLRALATLALVALLAAPLKRYLEGSTRLLLRPPVIIPTAVLLLLVCLALSLRADLGLPRDRDSGNGEPLRSAAWRQRPPNILLVMLDTTRADRLSVYGYGKPTSPFLEELAREATLYERAIAPAPWTLPSAASLFTGALPHTHQAHDEHRMLREEFVTLAEILAARGYHTVGFSSNSVIGETHNLQQGFQQYYEVSKGPKRGLLSPIQRLSVMRVARLDSGERDKGAAACNTLARVWLDEWESADARVPFFMFVNFLEAHLPYHPPQPHRSSFSSGTVGEVIRPLVTGPFSHGNLYRLIGYPDLVSPDDYRQLGDLYDASLAYQDAQLRTLVGELERRGILEETVLVIVGDHGENLGEHGGLLGHAFSVHQTLLRVPLLVRYPPAFEAGLRHDGLVGTTGIFSTLLELAGASPDENWPPGVGSLPRRAEQEHEVVVSEYPVPIFELFQLANEARGVDIGSWVVRKKTIQNRDWKLIRPSAGEPVLFHLAKDPHETTALDPSAYPQGMALGRRLDEILAQLPRPSLATIRAQESMDEQTRDALRALGYLR